MTLNQSITADGLMRHFIKRIWTRNFRIHIVHVRNGDSWLWEWLNYSIDITLEAWPQNGPFIKRPVDFHDLIGQLITSRFFCKVMSVYVHTTLSSSDEACKCKYANSQTFNLIGPLIFFLSFLNEQDHIKSYMRPSSSDIAHKRCSQHKLWKGWWQARTGERTRTWIIPFFLQLNVEQMQRIQLSLAKKEPLPKRRIYSSQLSFEVISLQTYSTNRLVRLSNWS